MLTVQPTLNKYSHEELINIKPIIVPYEQRTPEWRQARLGNVTGSKGKDTFLEVGLDSIHAAIRALTGLDAIRAAYKKTEEYNSFLQRDSFSLLEEAGLNVIESEKRRKYRQTRVSERLTSMETEQDKYMTYDMKWGETNEVLAIAKYKIETSNIVDKAFFGLHPFLRVGASPDGHIIDRKTGEIGILECKCLRSDNHLYNILKHGKVPEDYIVQCYIEMWIYNRYFCDFVGYDSRLPGKLDIFYIRIVRDEIVMKEVVAQVCRFLDECDKDEKYFRMMARVGWEKMQDEN